MFQMCLKTGDFDFDLQGQIGHLKILLLVIATTFEPWEFFLQT